MMTIERLREFKQGDIILSGVYPDTQDGLFMNGSRKDLRFVVKKQHGDCWTVYVHYATNSMDLILTNGDTVTMESNIRKCLPCTEEVFENYYY